MTVLNRKHPTSAGDPDVGVPVQSLVSTVLWGIAAGNGTGSQMTMHFGEKLNRPRRLDNPHLSKELRQKEGEFVLFVKCSWAIKHGDHAIANDGSSNRPQGVMLKALNRLLGRAVKRVTFAAKSLTIDFTGDLRLILHTKVRDDGWGNYSFSTADHRFVVGDHLEVEVQARRRQRN